MVKGYPDVAPGSGGSADNLPDNLILWINGVNGLEYIIEREERAVDSSIEEIQGRIDRFHTKEVKGNHYWYEWRGEAWKYVGTKDPTVSMEKRIEFLHEKRKEVRPRILKALVLKVGRHAVINNEKVKLGGYSDTIKLSGVIRDIRKAMGTGRITEKGDLHEATH